jgi:hypothetical protein
MKHLFLTLCMIGMATATLAACSSKNEGSRASGASYAQDRTAGNVDGVFRRSQRK